MTSFPACTSRRTSRTSPGADEVEAFWAERGFTLTRIPSMWRFQDREMLEAVVRLEFGEKLAPELLKEHEGLEVGYHYCLYHKMYRYPQGPDP